MLHWLFSYGTLQKTKVQLETFGRLLEGYHDTLTGYYLGQLQITDEAVLATSEQLFHPIAIPSANSTDCIHGMVFQVTEEELLHSDQYEVDDYQRVLVVLQSGKNAWVYVQRS